MRVRTPLAVTFVTALFLCCANRGMEAPNRAACRLAATAARPAAPGARVGSRRPVVVRRVARSAAAVPARAAPGAGPGVGTGGVGTGGVGTGGVGTGGVGTGGGGVGTGGVGTGGVGTGGVGTGGVGTGGAAGRGGAGGGAAGSGGSAGSGRGGGGGAAGAGGAAIPMLAYYPFDQTAGPVITDASGNGHNGTAQGTAAFVTGQIGNALNLNNGTSGNNYVALPANLLAGVNDITISTWVFVRTDLTWARIFDFGSSASAYMFLTAHAQGGPVRFAITTSGNGPGAEQQLSGASALPVGVWTHVAVVLQGTSNGVLYVNGTPVASSTSIPLRPSGLGTTPNVSIGRSQFADPMFDGLIDDFRIYARALTAAEIQAVHAQRSIRTCRSGPGACPGT